MKSVILGIIQGLTEFLPISSSGHLVLFKYLLKLESPGVVLETVLHAGTLISIFIYFRKRILRYVKGKNLLYIVVGTVPIGLAGVFLKEPVESLFSEPFIVLAMFSVTGILLFLTRTGGKEKQELNYKIALLVGTAQAFALIPGISRSGFTVATALLLGLGREKAFEFSFILSIPALMGAFIFKLPDIACSSSSIITLSLGGLTAMIFGLFALWIFYRTIKKKDLYLFSYYLWGVSILGILLFSTVLSPS